MSFSSWNSLARSSVEAATYFSRSWLKFLFARSISTHENNTTTKINISDWTACYCPGMMHLTLKEGTGNLCLEAMTRGHKNTKLLQNMSYSLNVCLFFWFSELKPQNYRVIIKNGGIKFKFKRTIQWTINSKINSICCQPNRINHC